MPIPTCERCRDQSYGDRDVLSLNPHVVLFGFLIPVLVNLVAANIEGTNEPLFKKHGINMWAFLLCVGVYCVALVSDINSRIHHQSNSSEICSLIAIISGSLSTVCLVSTFFPSLIGYIILSISWFSAIIFIAIYEDGRLYKHACRWIYHKFLKPIFTSIRNWFQGNNNTNPSAVSLSH